MGVRSGLPSGFKTVGCVRQDPSEAARSSGTFEKSMLTSAITQRREYFGSEFGHGRDRVGT
jgi:hypothetical protein